MKTTRRRAERASSLPFMVAAGFSARAALEEIEDWERATAGAAYVVKRCCAVGIAPISVDVSHDCRPGASHRKVRAVVHVSDAAETRLRVFGAAPMPALEEDGRDLGFTLRGVWVFCLNRRMR